MRPKSALIIDDDPIFHIVAEEALLALGAERVVAVDDGAAGLARIETDPDTFDLIVCDLQMPKLDGVSTIRELGRIGFKGVLVIASGEDGDVIKTVRTMAQMVGIRVAGALKKPLVTDELRSLLATDAAGVAPSESDQLITRHALKTALADGRVAPFYQPKLNLRTGVVDGVEVLARVKDAQGRWTSPAAYLEAAEREDLMLAFTLVILEQAINHAERWRAAGFELGLALNVSPTSLGNLDLPDMLAERFKAADLDPSLLTLEITENRLLEHDANVLEVLSRFRLHGFRLSMDDFGTGATSFEQLRLYPFNELKIDRSFIQAAKTDEFARTTVDTSARLAAMLGIGVVAEGVESEDQLKLATEAGAQCAQGFLLSKPMPCADLLNWLENAQVNTTEAA